MHSQARSWIRVDHFGYLKGLGHAVLPLKRESRDSRNGLLEFVLRLCGTERHRETNGQAHPMALFIVD